MYKRMPVTLAQCSSICKLRHVAQAVRADVQSILSRAERMDDLWCSYLAVRCERPLPVELVWACHIPTMRASMCDASLICLPFAGSHAVPCVTCANVYQAAPTAPMDSILPWPQGCSSLWCRDAAVTSG